jgi:hypothetical protein
MDKARLSIISIQARLWRYIEACFLPASLLSMSRRITPMTRAAPQFFDEPPQSLKITPYDHAHRVLYIRLLDADRDGADWREAVQVLFGLDPDRDPERCRQIHAAHLARAKWMTHTGYRQLLD